MTRRIAATVILALALAPLAPAGGPVYSRFALGDILHFGSNRAYAMGITGVAFTEDGFVNIYNPASLSRLSLTRFTGGFEYVNSSIEDAGGSQRFATGSFQSLALAIPASSDDGIVIFGAVTPYSLVDYDVVVQETVAGSASTQTFSGTGGVSTLSLGTTYRPVTDLSLGLTFSYHYGAIQHRSKVDFADAAFADNELRTSQFLSGTSFTFGMTYGGLSSLLGTSSLQPLTLGLVLTTPATLSIKEERFLLTQRTADTSLVRRGTGSLPFRWGLGAAYTGAALIVSGDLVVEQWSSADFFDPPAVEVNNSLRAGLGIEFPARRDPTSYWERVAYRTGFAYHASYISINGQPVNGWSVSGGIAFPIGPDARMNLGLQVGSRGTTDNGLSKESFFKLSLSIDASEAWFLTIEED